MFSKVVRLLNKTTRFWEVMFLWCETRFFEGRRCPNAGLRPKDEFDAAIGRLSNNRASGPDWVPAELFKWPGEDNRDEILEQILAVGRVRCLASMSRSTEGRERWEKNLIVGAL